MLVNNSLECRKIDGDTIPTKTPAPKLETSQSIIKKPTLFDNYRAVERKKSVIAEKELIQLVKQECEGGCSAEEKNDANFKGNVNLTKTLVSTISIPEVEPIKLVLNVASTSNSTETLRKNIENKDYLGVATEGVSSVKNYWGTAVSGVEVLAVTSRLAAKKGIVSQAAGETLAKYTARLATTANKIALPFAITGTVLSGIDVVKEAGKIVKRERMLNDIKQLEKNGVTYKRQMAKAKKTVKEDLRKVEINTAYKGVSFAFSAVSTGALIMSIKNPSSAKIAVPVSIATGVVSGVASVFSDSQYRTAFSNFVSDKKNKLFPQK